MSQKLDKVLSALAAGGDLLAHSRALKGAAVWTIVPAGEDEISWEPSPIKIRGRHQGREIVFLAAFGSSDAARRFMGEARERLILSGDPAAASANGAFLVEKAESSGLGLWLEPSPAEGGGRFLAAAEVVRLLEPEPAASSASRAAIGDLDLTRSRTLEELCEIYFDESPAELGIRLGRLVECGTVEAHPSPFEPEVRLYEPLAAFYLGFLGQGARCREFRGWFKTLMTAAYLERGNLARELMALAKEGRELRKSLEFSESFKQKVKREYLKLKARLQEAQSASAAELAAMSEALEAERAARRKEGAAMSRLYQEIVELENDLLAVEQWPYPMSLGEVMEAAERLYSSKLVILPGPARVEVSQPALERDPRLISEAVRTLRLLAVDLHPMRFKFGNLDPVSFNKRTGLRLVIPVGREAASGTACARKVQWRGRDVVCDSYIQNTRDDFRLLVHFKALEEERKFLVSHLTAFALSGLFKLVPGHD
jgi:hypothetical protein